MICFLCGFHGITGATISIARLANLLAERYSVRFVASATSDFNRLVGRGVELVREPDKGAELFVVDGHVPLTQIRTLRESNKKVLITAHGIFPSDLKLEKIASATATHLVGIIQLVHHRNVVGEYFVIPNYCDQLPIRRSAGSVGIVGRVLDKRKNVVGAVAAALRSKARRIHVWGGEGPEHTSRRVKYHPWNFRSARIYRSFAVLLSLSLEESFGLTVIEAMSAGIPCVLSDISAFRQFADCPGVAIVNPDDLDAVAAQLNQFLDQHEKLAPLLVDYWRKRYSREVVSKLWYEELDKLLGN